MTDGAGQEPAVPPGDRRLLGTLLTAAGAIVGLYYAVGIVLAVGFFFDIGLPLMTAFSPAELAAVGYLNLAGLAATMAALLLVLLLPFAGLLALGDRAGRAVSVPPALARILRPLGAIAIAAYIAAAVLLGLSGASYLSFLLSLCAIVGVATFGAAFALGREEWLRSHGRIVRWFVAPLFLFLALLAIGSAELRIALERRTALVVELGPVNARHGAILLVQGGGAILYARPRDQGYVFVLADPKAEWPIRRIVASRP